MTLQPNDLILNGKYRIDALIGEGAFAQVYRATHLQLQAPRAVEDSAARCAWRRQY